MMKSVYLSLGTNLGNKMENLNKAYLLISQQVGFIAAQSKVLETEPWGYTSDELFFNSVIEVKTKKTPLEIYELIQKIEKELGRQPNKTETYQDRLIDIDIIDYNGAIWMNENLSIPHEKMHLRFFVLEPLSELNSTWVHPISKLSIKELKSRLL
jgi:2-amino-4-hydroxy-6-hydroxymethyldihydropteridine diphosphokinase